MLIHISACIICTHQDRDELVDGENAERLLACNMHARTESAFTTEQNPQNWLSYQDGDELVDGEDAERLLGGDGQHLAQVVQRAQLRSLVVRLPQRHQDALPFVCGINPTLPKVETRTFRGLACAAM